MKIIGSVKEDLSLEKRVSITPETVKKLINLNFSVLLEKKYGEHIGIADEKYKNEGMSAYSKIQEKEFAREKDGYTSVKHQREVGTSYFDAVSNTISSGKSSTTAMDGSTEEEQF